MKKVLSSIITILLMIMLIVGFASADKADEYLEPEHTLISSANTDDDGIDGPSMWGESTGEVVFVEGGGK